MDTNWQKETWSAINHLAPVMPELSEEKHIVQNKDKFKGLWLAYFPQRTKPIKWVVNIVNNLFVINSACPSLSTHSYAGKRKRNT